MITTLSGASAAVQAIARAWNVEVEAAAGAAARARRARAGGERRAGHGLRADRGRPRRTGCATWAPTGWCGWRARSSRRRRPAASRWRATRPAPASCRGRSGRSALDGGGVGVLVDPAYGVGALASARELTLLGPLGRGYELAGAARRDDAAGRPAASALTVLVDVPARAGRADAAAGRVPHGGAGRGGRAGRRRRGGRCWRPTSSPGRSTRARRLAAWRPCWRRGRCR